MQDVLLIVVGRWRVKMTSCGVILRFFEYLLNWHWTNVFFTCIHSISLITSKQSNQVSFKPLSWTWPTLWYQKKVINLVKCLYSKRTTVLPSLFFWFNCCKRDLILKTFRESTSSYKTQRYIQIRMRSDRRKVGQLIRISNLIVELTLFLSCVRFVQ